MQRRCPGPRPRRPGRPSRWASCRPSFATTPQSGWVSACLVHLGELDADMSRPLVRAASASVQDSDAALVAALVRRDPQAMEEVYDRYGRPAYSLARRITGDGQLAEDVVQEVFLMIWSDVLGQLT